MTWFTEFCGGSKKCSQCFKMIKEETMKGRSPILKRLLQDGVAPGYTNCRNHINSNFRRKTPTLKSSNRGSPDPTVRFGRVPKNEKERIRLAMEKASITIPQQEFNDDFLITSITSRYIRSSELLSGDSIKDIIRRAEESPNVSPISTCPLNPYVGTDDFNQKFSPMVREVVTFAKNIPGFTDIRHDDKITLLRACVFEVLLIRFGALIDSKNRKMVTVSGCIIYASIYSNVKASHDFVNTLFKFIDRINALNLTDEEMALFLAAIVINPKRQGLSELSKITALHKRIVHCLQLVMQRERPNNPNLYQELVGSLNDLWILNGMHSKQTQGKHRTANTEESMDGVSSGVQTELGNNQFQVYQNYPEMPSCPISSSYLASSPEYEDKRRTIDETSPTSPTSTFSPDEEMRSPGSADSGCSTDSGCSIESGCSSDSGCSVSSVSMLSNESSCRRHGLHSDDHRESISCPDDETTEKLRKCHIKRKPHTSADESSRLEAEKSKLSPWHKPQKEVEKTTDSPVLRKCLESPVTFKMEAFGDFYRSRGAHRHKKFRPSVERQSLLHEVLDSSTSSPHPSTSPSLSYSSSPSPSSSISSSPSRYSSDFGSSLPSPSYSPSSILAQRLRLPASKYPETSSLLSQEPKFGSSKEAVRDTLYDCIMNGQSKIPRQSFVAYDLSRPSPYPSCHMSSSHSTSPPPSHHSSPSHQFSSSPYHVDDSQPLNLSTKTPSPPPAMEA